MVVVVLEEAHCDHVGSTDLVVVVVVVVVLEPQL